MRRSLVAAAVLLGTIVAVSPAVRGLVPGGSHLEFMQNSEDWWLAHSR